MCNPSLQSTLHKTKIASATSTLVTCHVSNSRYPQLKGPLEIVDCESIPNQKWLHNPCHLRGPSGENRPWLENGPKKMPSALTSPTYIPAPQRSLAARATLRQRPLHATSPSAGREAAVVGGVRVRWSPPPGAALPAPSSDWEHGVAPVGGCRANACESLSPPGGECGGDTFREGQGVRHNQGVPDLIRSDDRGWRKLEMLRWMLHFFL